MEMIRKRSLWRECPVRLCLLILSLLWTGIYFLTRGSRDWMNLLCRTVVRPWHRLAGRFFGLVSFSVTEWILLACVLAAVCFLVQLAIHFIRRRPGRGLFRWAVTLLLPASLAFSLFCLWWGVLYYSDSFSEQAGIETREISVEELQSVTQLMADKLTEYSDRVDRDEEGVFTCDLKDLFARSGTIYRAAEQVFPCLSGPELNAKPALFSELMSDIHYTGYFFPYTAECNVNTASPQCMIPSTIAHELAHQRGVAGEDECNFLAVVTCLMNDDAEYAYSGALLGYVYLGNALYSADYDAWYEIYSALPENVRADLHANNAYWDRYETKASEVSEKVYEGFLATYGDDRGMKSYGACVDLLVAWYLPE